MRLIYLIILFATCSCTKTDPRVALKNFPKEWGIVDTIGNGYQALFNKGKILNDFKIEIKDTILALIAFTPMELHQGKIVECDSMPPNG